MDFGALLSAAKKNENNKQSTSYYPAKFTPPKKENRQSQVLSNNIKLFLAKKEAEEKRKASEESLKKKNLLALRDHKAQSKINKHLKVCKSANKSVLDDAVDMENTAITMAGPSQPDEDDYGYVSQEASAFYNKLMNKYQSLPPEKSIFAAAGKKTVKDIASTKDRVKQALKQQEIEESQGHRRKRKSTKTVEEETKVVVDEKKSSDNTHKSEKPKPKNRPLPPAMDFGQLLKLAAQKQHEPIVIDVKPKPEEPERLMTKKQLREYAREKECRDAREERNRLGENNLASNKLPTDNNKPEKSNDSKPQESNKVKKITVEKSSVPNKKPTQITPTDRNPTNLKSTPQKSKHKDDILDERKKLEIERKKLEEMRRSIEEEKRKLSVIKKKNNVEKTNTNVPTNKVPSKIGNTSARDLGKVNSTKQSVERSLNSKQSKLMAERNLKMSRNSKVPMKNKKYTNGRAIFKDDDDDEYDSELDDFIDNGDEEDGSQDYSKYISEIFGYDKNKYKSYYDDEDDDDRAMESNFAQQLKEEYVSTKIGIMEDLEDIRMESMEKKRKAMIKKKRKV
ncbi:protein SPT2 homolog [Leptopilina heterotoma]|uniref:protein SPT2 homolog n=1 Tax=Leptopilina heterotoma TaxID=63436 RepID=UPI001CA8A694|nr:protein SPT2 homolog [Leptopilina heterotoma]